MSKLSSTLLRKYFLIFANVKSVQLHVIALLVLSNDLSREMAMLFKYFKKQSFPTSNEVQGIYWNIMESLLLESDCDSEDDPFANID